MAVQGCHSPTPCSCRGNARPITAGRRERRSPRRPAARSRPAATRRLRCPGPAVSPSDHLRQPGVIATLLPSPRLRADPGSSTWLTAAAAADRHVRARADQCAERGGLEPRRRTRTAPFRKGPSSAADRTVSAPASPPSPRPAGTTEVMQAPARTLPAAPAHPVQLLEAAGIPVWRDTADLWPGEDWRMNIRRAITDNALVFIACFSLVSLARSSGVLPP